MRVSLPRMLACVAMMMTVAAVPVAAAPGPASSLNAPWTGIWANGNNTMHVRAAPCGDAMCGTVIWADDKTKALIASKGRTLIGTEVFRAFRKIGDNEWKGEVYVPAIDQTVTGRILLTTPDSITASGCALFGLGCQTRHWKRIR